MGQTSFTERGEFVMGFMWEIRDGSPYIGQLEIRWTGKLANQEEDQAEAELWRDPNGLGSLRPRPIP